MTFGGFVKSKVCQYPNCGRYIFWNNDKKWFTDSKDGTGPRHRCLTHSQRTYEYTLTDVIKEIEVLKSKVDSLRIKIDGLLTTHQGVVV